MSKGQHGVPVAHNHHIVMVNSSMVCGGAERVISILAERWVSTGTRVTIVTIHSQDRDHYTLDPRIGRLSLDADKESNNVFAGMLNNLWRIRKLRKAIKGLCPSVIISFQDVNNVLSLIAAARLSIPVVVCERNDPRMRPIAPIRSRMRRLLYRRASALVVQTQSLEEWGRSIVDVEKVHIVPNPVTCPKSIRRSNSRRQDTIVAAGRLVKQKGFDILLQAISLCDRKWALKIIGEGPERSNLEMQAKQLGIADQVQFVGQVDDPSIIFRDASLFVLSSRYEGFPNVLVEAMACGLPAVCFDCASGPAEIVRQGIDGLLVPPGDASAMAIAINQLMQAPEQRLLFAERASDVVERFSADKIMAKWDSLVSDVCRVGG